jgi:hypothetical protein
MLARPALYHLSLSASPPQNLLYYNKLHKILYLLYYLSMPKSMKTTKPGFVLARALSLVSGTQKYLPAGRGGYACNPSTQEAGGRRTASSRPAWATE